MKISFWNFTFDFFFCSHKIGRRKKGKRITNIPSAHSFKGSMHKWAQIICDWTKSKQQTFDGGKIFYMYSFSRIILSLQTSSQTITKHSWLSQAKIILISFDVFNSNFSHSLCLFQTVSVLLLLMLFVWRWAIRIGGRIIWYVKWAFNSCHQR